MDSTAKSMLLGLMMIASCLLHDGAVHACAVGTDACTRCSGDDRCLNCADGFALDLSTYTCKPKQTNAGDACDPHCASSCTSAGAGFCDTSCDPGYVLVDNKCKLCDSNCDPSSGCSETGKCNSKCIYGYTLVDKNCQACASHCKSGCDKKGASFCDTECELGYALTSNDKCFVCDVNCDLTVAGCSQPYTCDGQCKAGFVLTKRPNGMKICLPCDENCAGTCNVGNHKCDEGQCKPGYTTCRRTKTCRPCSTGCDTTVGCNIAGPGRCDQCLPGFNKDKDACYEQSPNDVL